MLVKALGCRAKECESGYAVTFTLMQELVFRQPQIYGLAL